MRRLARALVLPLAAAALLAFPSARAGAEDGGDESESEPTLGPPDAKDDSTPLYLKALDLQRKGKWKEAQAAFREIREKYPDSCHAADCEFRGGVNCYMGTTKLHESGPPARRIDVAVMGDGFQNDVKAQEQQEQWARECIKVLHADAAYVEYHDYFNYYFVRLVSKDDGVDKPLTDKEKEDLQKKRSKRRKVRATEFDTAIDCKAAGPQGQVMADRDLVYKWLDYANRDVPGCGDEGLVIAFAKFGVLGMGGAGVANVGRPDKSVTVHEFGHAFVGLLDEYTNNPGPPLGAVRAPNATSDKNAIPWQHFLDRKVEGVGVFEGGATHKVGVWRPCQSGCAMNSAGASRGYCPVCREACVLRIYSYCSPIDQTSPSPETERECTEGDGTTVSVTPMRPATHDLVCTWTIDRVPDSDPGPQPVVAGSHTTDEQYAFEGWDPGPRITGRDTSLYQFPPFGMEAPPELVRVEKEKGRVTKHVLDVAKLDPGRYMITATVVDPCPWVLRDDKHLLEERATFWYRVGKKRK